MSQPQQTASAQGWPRKFKHVDKWKLYGINTATTKRAKRLGKQKDHEQETAPQPLGAARVQGSKLLVAVELGELVA